MGKRSSSNVSRRSSSFNKSLNFDEFGFALSRKKDRKLHHRCHEYSYPQLSPVGVKELCELLSYWNGDSFICRSQIERFIRLGIPPSLRGSVWKCLLNIDALRENSDFTYQRCLSEVRGPLVDLGVSEYGILAAISTLSDTQNDLGLKQSSSGSESCCSVDEIGLFRQIVLDLQRSFPTHRSLMGDSPEAIEGQAKLFRVLIAYAKYNPHVGYSQGMSYIAAVLLMQLGEEEAFWALTALLDKTKYLSELFDRSLTKVQHQVKVFDHFLRHRKPRFSKHLDSAGVLSVHFVTPWFLTLFTSLPCWDSVLAAWDLIMLQGLPAVYRSALTIMELLEPRLMELNDEGAMLPLLLRVPVDVAQYTVFAPALWRAELQDWELKCLNNLVLDEGHHGPEPEEREKQKTTSTQVETGNERQRLTSSEGSAPGAVSLYSRMMRLAQRYVFNKHSVGERSPQTQTSPEQQRPGGLFQRRTSASFPKVQRRSKRRSQQSSRSRQPAAQQSPVAVRESAERCKQSFKRSGTAPVGKVPRCRSSRSIVRHVRTKSHLQNKNDPPNQTPQSTVLLPPAPPPFSNSSSSNPPASCSFHKEQHEANMALIRELSSRHQTSVALRNVRESKLI
ncbi:uncharacterized protein si:ch211-266k8.4 isoform X2 [Austrofundulus limnaeus]|uniref:Uncharacterized protein si:ch211-266k8.4 isoform X2 n=1 Tax=Austrofundulus limnaeus TaxID=52670 RepID=A0A2I4D819_AUSLI|nr:PREDICTED: uncharacterized protein LOC106535811 isoform X2 [Austrofundulus limnaeus]